MAVPVRQRVAGQDARVGAAQHLGCCQSCERVSGVDARGSAASRECDTDLAAELIGLTTSKESEVLIRLDTTRTCASHAAIPDTSGGQAASPASTKRNYRKSPKDDKAAARRYRRPCAAALGPCDLVLRHCVEEPGRQQGSGPVLAEPL